MKKTSIFFLVLIAVAVGIIIATFGKISTYETFTTAAENSGNIYHVIGTLDEGHTVQYGATSDAHDFIFFAKDKRGTLQKVIFNGALPQDFDKSKQLALTGYIKNGLFYCNDIQIRG
jgi:cytochrome c-type biogenesis protein CcmE